jgi:hypothetical protein
MHKSATKCNETIGKWCKNKHGTSKIIGTFETYQLSAEEIEQRIRNIIKVGQDEPLKLKIPMYENGCCPKVSVSPYSAITANFS